MALRVNAQRDYRPLYIKTTAIVSPAKAGFFVNFWWLYPWTGEWKKSSYQPTTDANGKAIHTGAFGWDPVTLRASISAGQVVDGVEYGEYTSEEITLHDMQEGDLHLYPEAVSPPNWWDKIKAWWNGLSGVKKALIVTTSVGTVIVGGATFKKG